MHKKFEVNRTNIVGGCHSYIKAAPQQSWSDLTLSLNASRTVDWVNCIRYATYTRVRALLLPASLPHTRLRGPPSFCINCTKGTKNSVHIKLSSLGNTNQLVQGHSNRNNLLWIVRNLNSFLISMVVKVNCFSKDIESYCSSDPCPKILHRMILIAQLYIWICFYFSPLAC